MKKHHKYVCYFEGYPIDGYTLKKGFSPAFLGIFQIKKKKTRKESHTYQFSFEIYRNWRENKKLVLFLLA